MFVNKILLALGLVSFTFILSCKKNDPSTTSSSTSSTTTTTTTIIDTFGTKLVNIFEIDTLITNGNDTITKWGFAYDNNNRIITDTQIIYNLYPNSTYTDIRNYFYNNDDSIANKRIRRKIIANSNSTKETDDTTFFTVLNGQIIKDSIISSDPTIGISTNNINYTNTGLTNIQKNWTKSNLNNPNQIIQNVGFDNNYASTNQIDSIYSVVNNQTTPINIIQTTSYYNNGVNPFFKIFGSSQINFYNNYENLVGIGNIINSNYAPTKLLTQQTIQNLNDGSSNYLFYYYILRADGYPLTAFANYFNNIKNTSTKLVFVYTK